MTIILLAEYTNSQQAELQTLAERVYKHDGQSEGSFTDELKEMQTQ